MTAFRIPAWAKAPTPWSAIAQLFAASWRGLQREAELRSAERTLEGLPDLVLKDIGMSKGSISRQVRTSLGRRAIDRSEAVRSRAVGSEHRRFGSAGVAGISIGTAYPSTQ